MADFGATTSELIRMAKWLQERRVETVAMESTGVYWIAPHEVLGRSNPIYGLLDLGSDK